MTAFRPGELVEMGMKDISITVERSVGAIRKKLGESEG